MDAHIKVYLLALAIPWGGCGTDEADRRDGGVDVVDVSDTSDSADSADSDADAASCSGADPGGTCSGDGQRCEIGQECCCGECSPSLVCSCSGGTWACYYTDYCLRPACEDTADTEGTPDTVDTADTPDTPDTPDTVDADDVADGSSPACGTARTALADLLYAKPVSAFTAVVRLDHDNRTLLGYALVIGSYAGLGEAAARAAAQMATGYGDAGQLLSGPTPEDVWVFYEPPGDFGGVGVVSAHTGLPVFGGSIVWDGRGDISFPHTWLPPASLASGCATTGASGATRGFDLVSGGALASADVDAARAVVRQTALVDAMWERGYVFDSVVLRYPRTVGAFDPTSAEWIVLVSGGWLE